MQALLWLTLVTCSTCLAHYRDTHDSRNFIVREEPLIDDEGEIVECPVCEETEHWMVNHEKCTTVRGNKLYKRCTLGTYRNEVCGNRLDCYSGPGEVCTDKRELDMYGKKCAPGYYCNKKLGVCTGLGYTVDSNVQWKLNGYPYTWRRDPAAHSDSFAPIRN